MLNPNNQTICFDGQELIDIFRQIDFILISLADMGRNYELYQNHDAYEKDTARFIDECQVTQKLAKVRQIIASKFDDTLGDDDMDDLERAIQDTQYYQGNFVHQ